MYEVTISGKAWFSQAFAEYGPAALKKMPEADIRKLVETAKIIKRGKGKSVKLQGDWHALNHLQKWLHDDGQVWVNDGDEHAKAEGRACLEAAARIRAVIGGSVS